MLVDRYITSGIALGLGSGELVNLVIAEVGVRLASGDLKSIMAVPSCNAAASSAAFNGVPMTTLEQLGKVRMHYYLR
jgi:ribose 5-phosphate isomerase A